MKKELSASAQEKRPAHTRSIRKHEKKLQKLKLGMIVIGSAALLIGVLLLILPLFRVSRIEVEGNAIYSDEEIIEAVGITRGDEMLPIFFDGVPSDFYTTCCYVRDVKISYGFFKVKITVTEAQNVMYADLGDGTWISFDRDLRVLEKRSDPSSFERFLHVKLPNVYQAEPMETIIFENGALTYDYIASFLDILIQTGILPNVDYIDYSDKFHLSSVLEDRIRLEFGDVSDSDLKMKLFYEILDDNQNVEGCMIINVSNVRKTIFQKITSQELYQ